MEATIVSFLAPFLPFLIGMGKRTGEKAADALATEAGRRAKALWTKLLPHVESRPATAEAAADVAADPQDELARGALQLQLRKLFEHDDELRTAVAQMLAEAERRGVIATDGGVAIAGDVHADHGSIGVIGKVGGDLSMPRRAEDG